MPEPFVRRRFSRIVFAAPAQLRDASNRSWSCELVDISLNGVLVSRPDDWQGGVREQYFLDINLPDSHVYLQLTLEVAHLNDKFIGFRCLHIEEETRVHLHRLVELNLGDPKLLLRELIELWQAKTQSN